MAAADGRLAGFWSRISGRGTTAARLSGRVAGTGPGVFLLAGTGFGWSGWVRHRVDALPGGDGLAGPGPGSGDLEGSAASAEDGAGAGVQERAGGGGAGSSAQLSRGRCPGPAVSARPAGEHPNGQPAGPAVAVSSGNSFENKFVYLPMSFDLEIPPAGVERHLARQAKTAAVSQVGLPLTPPQYGAYPSVGLAARPVSRFTLSQR